ncbi:hypothetical protein V7O66_02860 [Methanolobus sp. ZRKC3]|uniref:hypothetical protein n=1 Tax=Methanolobus sp. ZRKC3 TaxID=3125786 RepID=UPI00324892DA
MEAGKRVSIGSIEVEMVPVIAHCQEPADLSSILMKEILFTQVTSDSMVPTDTLADNLLKRHVRLSQDENYYEI